MAPRWRQITEQTSATLHYTLSLSYFLSVSSLFVLLSCEALSTTLAISLYQSASAAALLFFNSLFLSLNLPPLVRSLSQALSLPPSQSLSFGSSSSPVFPHTVLSSVFMGRVLQRRHSPNTHTHPPTPPWILANHPLLTGSIQPAFTGNGPCN